MPENTNGQQNADKQQAEALDKEILEKIKAAGYIKPNKLEDLPDTLKEQVNKFVESKVEEAEKIEKDKLYKSIEKYKSDIDSLRTMLEKQQAEKDAEKAALEAKSKEEVDKTKPVEEKLKEVQLQASKAIEEFSQKAEKRVAELEKMLEIQKLSTYREQLIAKSNGELIIELLPNPETNQGVTKEILDKSFVTATEQYKKLREKFLTEAEKKAKEASTVIPTDKPTGTGHLSAQNNQTDFSKLASASKDELQRLKEEALRKYGF